MKLTKEETAVVRIALTALDNAQSIFCATHCDACPFNIADRDDCMFNDLTRRMDQVLENYGQEEEE